MLAWNNNVLKNDDDDDGLSLYITPIVHDHYFDKLFKSSFQLRSNNIDSTLSILLHFFLKLHFYEFLWIIEWMED